MKRHNAKHRKRGFTLIELLVVIAIIGILATFVVPALVGAKRQAMEKKAASNTRNICLGVLLYKDNKGRGKYFMGSRVGTAVNGDVDMANCLYAGTVPVLDDPTIWENPSAPTADYSKPTNNWVFTSTDFFARDTDDTKLKETSAMSSTPVIGFYNEVTVLVGFLDAHIEIYDIDDPSVAGTDEDTFSWSGVEGDETADTDLLKKQ